MRVLRFLFQLVKLSPTGIVELLVASIFVNVLYLISPIYMMHIYDSVIGANSDVNLVAVSALALFLYLVYFVIDALRARLLVQIAPKIEAYFSRLSQQIVSKKQMDGDYVLEAVKAIDRLQQFVLNPSVSSFFDLPFTPFFLFVAFLIHPIIGLVGMVGGLILVSISLGFGFKGDNLLSNYELEKRGEAEFGRSVFSQRDFVKSTEGQRFILDRWSEQRRKAHGLQQSMARSNVFSLSITKTLRMLLQSAVLGTGAYLVLQQNLSAGAIIAASVVVSRALVPIEQSVATRRMLMSAMQSMDKLQDYLHAGAGAKGSAVGVFESLTSGKMLVKNLHFQYEGSSKPILRNINFAVPEGSIVGVSGPNGSGKTTLVKCLMGALDIDKGSIEIGDVHISSNSVGRFAADIGYQPQSATIFPFSIYENIALAEGEEARQRAITIAKELGIHEMILSFEDGYDTHPIGPNGPILSPGIAQVIAIARAMCQQRKVLIFDEPLTALDNATGQKFLQALQRYKDTSGTVLMVSHNPQSIAATDFLLLFHPVAGPLFGPTKEILSRLQTIEGGKAKAKPAWGQKL